MRSGVAAQGPSDRGLDLRRCPAGVEPGRGVPEDVPVLADRGWCCLRGHSLCPEPARRGDGAAGPNDPSWHADPHEVTDRVAVASGGLASSRPATWDQGALDVGGDLRVLPGRDDLDTDTVVGVGIASGAVFALVARMVAAERVGAVTGVVGAAGGLGGFFPPLVMGLVYGSLGSYALGFLLLAATAATAGVFTATIVQRRAAAVRPAG
jgi:hypothetical protein